MRRGASLLLLASALLPGCRAPTLPIAPQRVVVPQRAVVRLWETVAPDEVVVGTPRLEQGRLLHRLTEVALTPAVRPTVVVPLAAHEAVVVRVRVRASGRPADELVILQLESAALRRVPRGGSAAVVEARDRIEAMPGDTTDPRSFVQFHVDASEWQQLTLRVDPLPGRRALEIAVSHSDGPIEVASIEVAAVPSVQRLLDGTTHGFGEWREEERDSALARWQIDVRRGDETLPALLLHPGGQFRWRLAVPPNARLAAQLAAVTDGGESVAAQLAIDGVPQSPWSGHASPLGAERWEAAGLALDRFAGRTVELNLALPAEAPGSLLIGALQLLAPPPPAAARRKNLLLISIDTLRADQVGCYGGDPAVTPCIDRLAAEGTRFAQFHAASSWTLPSHATLFSAQEPPVHGAQRQRGRVDGTRTPLLPVALAQAGYATAAFTGGGFMDPAFGLAAGFALHSVRDPGRTMLAGRELPGDPMEPVVEWLDAHRELPFFLFVHTYVVHDYSPDAAALAQEESVAPWQAKDATALVARLGAGEVELAPVLRRFYRAALRQADTRVVGRLLARLAELELDDSTVVALVSDHGDQWLEHDGLFHGSELWSELVRVPFLVRGPGFAPGAVRDDLASHVDVATTLLPALGVAPPAAMRGRDLLAESCEPRPQLATVLSADGSKAAAVTSGEWRLVRRFTADPEIAPTLHLFHIAVDPGEQHDLAAQEPERLAQMLRWLDAALAECAAAASSGEPGRHDAAVDERLRQQLEELGYTGD